MWAESAVLNMCNWSSASSIFFHPEIMLQHVKGPSVSASCRRLKVLGAFGQNTPHDSSPNQQQNDCHVDDQLTKSFLAVDDAGNQS